MNLAGLRVQFRHNLKKRTTECSIKDVHVELGTGKSTCCRADFKKLEGNPKEFKAQGRKRAMKRALEAANIPKEVRSTMWEQYRTSTKEPRW